MPGDTHANLVHEIIAPGSLLGMDGDGLPAAGASPRKVKHAKTKIHATLSMENGESDDDEGTDGGDDETKRYVWGWQMSTRGDTQEVTLVREATLGSPDEAPHIQIFCARGSELTRTIHPHWIALFGNFFFFFFGCWMRV